MQPLVVGIQCGTFRSVQDPLWHGATWAIRTGSPGTVVCALHCLTLWVRGMQWKLGEGEEAKGAAAARWEPRSYILPCRPTDNQLDVDLWRRDSTKCGFWWGNGVVWIKNQYCKRNINSEGVFLEDPTVLLWIIPSWYSPDLLPYQEGTFSSPNYDFIKKKKSYPSHCTFPCPLS